MQSAHPEILKEYSRRPKAEEAVMLWIWMGRNYSHVLRDEWPLEAKRLTIRSDTEEKYV
jgi:hypothetical protein